MSFFQLSWFSYFISGTAAVMASWLLSGCRLGNHLELPQNPDQISGYYETAPQSFEVCATYDHSSCNLNTPVNQIPSMPAVIMSNPVILLMKDLKTGEALLGDSRGSGYAIRIFADESGRLTDERHFNPSTFWVDEPCYWQESIVEEGTYSKNSPGVSVSNQEPKISGKIELSFEYYFQFFGTCDQTLGTLYSCYLDPNKCGDTDSAKNAKYHLFTKSIFDLYLAAQVMQETDIKTAKALYFKVLYK